MIKELFTPGPWEVITHYGNNRLINDYTDKPYSCVVPENGSWPEDTVCEVWGENQLDVETAQLIAAAPDLYYALKACRDRLYEQFGDCVPVQQADIALNKALGIEEETNA